MITHVKQNTHKDETNEVITCLSNTTDAHLEKSKLQIHKALKSYDTKINAKNPTHFYFLCTVL